MWRCPEIRFAQHAWSDQRGPYNILIHIRPVASQPGGGGVWTWMGGTPGAPPPLDIVRVTSSIWKTPPLLDIQAPPLGHCPCDVINLKNAPTLGHSQAPPPLGHCPCDVIHIFQGWNKIAKGWNKIAEGWNKIAKGWNKIAERWNKIAKGWNKIFGMGNWGGRTTPPTPPGYGPAYTSPYSALWKFTQRRIQEFLNGVGVNSGSSKRQVRRDFQTDKQKYLEDIEWNPQQWLWTLSFSLFLWTLLINLNTP